MSAAQITDVITCPACRTEIQLSEAVESRLRTKLDGELASERQKLAEQLKQLASRETSVKQLEADVAERVQKELAAERKKLVADARDLAKQELCVELDDQASQLSELRADLKKAQEAELALRQSERKLKERAESLELEVARRMDAEREMVRKKAQEDAAEAHRLKEAEMDQQIAGLRRKIDELKQKAEQGSVQLQGEVLELDIEQMLRSNFPLDSVLEVSKGVNGADVSQSVVSATGAPCGVILWETKRTKNWSNVWLEKLRDDQREAKAAAAVIVSEALPPEIKTIGCIGGVWVCSRSCAAGLAAALRAGIIEIAKARQAAEGRNEKVELVYSYLSSREFKGRVAGIVESFVALQDDLVTEKRAMQRRWAKREKQLERAVTNATGLYGDLEGIIGGTMPQIEQLQLLHLEDKTEAA